jgi:hypothetical protein
MGSSATRVENTRAETERSVRPSQQTVTRDIERVAGTNRLVGTGIAFGSTNEITDTGSGLAVFTAGEVLEVRGSASNDGEYIVQTSAAGTLTVVPNIVTEAAGATIELRRK